MAFVFWAVSITLFECQDYNIEVLPEGAFEIFHTTGIEQPEPILKPIVVLSFTNRFDS